MQFNNQPRKIKNNMTTIRSIKSIGRSPSRLGFFLPALAAACFAFLPFATADNGLECRGRGPNVTNEGNRPRARKIHIVGDPNGNHFTTTQQCVPEKVLLSGGVVVKFKVNGQKDKLVPDSANLENFHGQGLGSGPGSHREYVANVSIKRGYATNTLAGGKFNVIVHVTTKPNSLPYYHFFLKWTVRYSWNGDNQLTSFGLFDGFNRQCEPQVKCKLDPAEAN
jgi:hypothetical protein